MTTPDDVVQSVLSYVNHQAGKGPDELRRLIERTVAEFDERLAGMSEEQARFRPGDDEWSVNDVLHHISSATAWTAGVASALARGGATPPAGDVSPEPAAGDGSLASLRARMADAWDAVRRSLDGLPAEPDLSAAFRHPAFGDLNCMQWLAFVRVHALDHAQQIDEIKADRGYPAA